MSTHFDQLPEDVRNQYYKLKDECRKPLEDFIIFCDNILDYEYEDEVKCMAYSIIQNLVQGGKIKQIEDGEICS